MTDHTPEPWYLHEGGRMDVMAQGWGTVATILAPHLEASQANAARIVACVNACAGIPTEQLTHVYAWNLLQRLEEAQNVIEALQARLAGPVSGQNF